MDVVAVAIFLAALAAIAFEWAHRTKIALLGTEVVNGVVPAFKKVTDTVPTPVLKVLGGVVGTVAAAIAVQRGLL